MDLEELKKKGQKAEYDRQEQGLIRQLKKDYKRQTKK